MSPRPLVFDRALWALAAVLVTIELIWRPGFSPAHQGLAGLLLLVTGLPHGAFDEGALRSGPLPIWQARLVYVAVAAAAAAAWLVSPSGALAAFLGLSILHFGAGEMTHPALTPAGRRALGVSRGALVTLLPFFAHPERVRAPLEALGARPFAPSPSAATVAVITLVLGHGALLLHFGRPAGRARVAHELAQTAVLAALLIVLHPVLGFAVYFGAWHAPGYLYTLAARDGGSARARLRAAAPNIALALAGLLLTAAAWPRSLGAASTVAAAVIFVSALTWPHVLLVDGWIEAAGRWAWPSRRGRRPSTSGRRDARPAQCDTLSR
jgi:Brp/Blh family beta-carotene 15,15'-monooxygenase